MLLTCEVDWLLQMHHGDVGLLRLFVVLAVDDDAIDSSGLDFGRVYARLSVKSKNGQPRPKVHVLPVKQKKSRKTFKILLNNVSQTSSVQGPLNQQTLTDHLT